MSFSTTSSRTGPSSARVSASAPEIRMSACLDGGTPLPTQLLELARLDLSFITDRPLRFGTPLQIAIFSDFVSAVTQNRATVHWCRPHPHGWQVGAFLAQALPDRLIEHQWSDIRGSLRYDCNWKAWVLWDNGGKLESVRILNYSISGLCMSSTCAVIQNQNFSLFGSAGSRDRAVLNGHVQWCRKSEDGFQIGGCIDGQRGKDLPRMFGNLAAVHVTGVPDDPNGGESLATQRCAMELEERFLSPEQANTRRPYGNDDAFLLQDF